MLRLWELAGAYNLQELGLGCSGWLVQSVVWLGRYFSIPGDCVFFPILYRNPSVLLGESEWLLARDRFLLSLIQRCSPRLCLRKKTTSKYCRNWGSKVNSSSWEVPYPTSWDVNWILAWVMVSKYLHNDICTTDKSDGPRVISSTVQILHMITNVHLINLKIRPIKWEASSHCCSAWYLLQFDQTMSTSSL